MRIITGIAAASGIARGTVCLYTSEVENELPHYAVPAENVPAELGRFKQALERAKSGMRRMVQTAEAQQDRKAVDIFTAHLMMLDDEALSNKTGEMIAARGINAEHAVIDVFAGYIKRYENEEGHFRELAHDFADTRDRILEGFSGETGKFKCGIGATRPVIVAAHRLTPSMVLTIPREHVLAFVAQEGGLTSHAVILARSYNVPILLGIDIEKELDCGMEAIVDGARGKLLIAPDRETGEYYRRMQESRERKKNLCIVRKGHAAQTRGGKRIALKVNISTMEELAALRDLPHDGIGLVRTEFLFIRRNEPPCEQEQIEAYRKILNAGGAKPVTLRLLDISGDKMPRFLSTSGQEGEARGALAVQLFPDLYRRQIKAVLQANVNGNARLLFPMVSDSGDLKTFRSIVSDAARELRREKKGFSGADIPLGVMIETPAGVMMARELLAEADFVNIGSNDLLQYTLAAERGDLLAEERYHIMHPALLRMLAMVVREGRRARKEVCLCGEIASYEEFYPLLLQTGLRSFSVAAAKYNDVKCELLHLSGSRRRHLVDSFLKTRTKKEADRYIVKLMS